MYGTSVSRMLSRTCSCNRSPFYYNLRERKREIGESQRSVGQVKNSNTTRIPK